MNIYTFQNFTKKPNSTATPTGAGTLHTCVFKDGCSIVNPVFVLDGIDLSVNYVQFNNRYYFVRDIVLQNKNIYELHCEIDVLATWKSEIGSSTQYVLRSSDEYDGTIVDGFYPTKKTPTFIEQAAAAGPSWASDLNSGHYVVGIISGSSSQAGSLQQGCVQYYHMLPADFSQFAQKIFTDANWTNFQTADRYSFNPIQYVSSVMWFPFAPAISSSPLSSLKIGWETINIQCDPITDPIKTDSYNFQASSHPQSATRGIYLNSAPFSEYVLKFPPFADIEIDGDLLALNASVNHYINAYMQTDFVSGRSLLVVRMTTKVLPTEHYIFARREVQLGVNIQLAQIAANRIGVLQDGISTAGNVVSNLIQGNVVGAITGAASGILSAYQTAMPRVSSNGSNDSLLSLLNRFTDPYLYQIFHEVVDEDNTNHGRPLCQSRQISDLPGYILCANSEVSITGTLEEKERIQQYMDGGFFYE